MQLPTMVSITILVVMAAAGGCTTGSGASVDVHASMACSHFIDVIHDESNGVLTATEFRHKIKEVNSNASAANDPQIRQYGQALLRDATYNVAGVFDTTEFIDDVKTFTNACIRLGYLQMSASTTPASSP